MKTGRKKNNKRKELTAVQRKYLAICADPKEKRTQDEIADALEVSRQTLYTWRQNQLFRDEREALIKDFTEQHLPQVHSALLKRAIKDGDVAAIQTYFKLRNELNETLNINTAPIEVILREATKEEE